MKQIRIFGTPWHVAHNYSLLSIPGTQWGMLKSNIRNWQNVVRPFPDNAEVVPYYEPGKYDLAIIHVDQQCVDGQIGKGVLYRNLNAVIQDIPKIVINHGTPIWPERWEASGSWCWHYPLSVDANNIAKTREYQTQFLIQGGKTVQKNKVVEVEGMKKLVGNNRMIVNSFTAGKQWGWGKVIWHGLKADDWWDLPKEPRSVTQISPAGLDYYYGRDLLQQVIEVMRTEHGLRHTHMGNPNDWTLDSHPRFYDIGGWASYRDFLGRSLIYFNPTRESPMPRSRTEAMLSGCCLLTTGGQDAEMFINFDTRPIWERSDSVKDYIETVDEYLEQDINGFIVPENPQAVSALIAHLINNRYKQAMAIGQRGKQTAKTLFNKERYDEQWRDILEKALEVK